ncbi:hypothetical protein [Natronoflexus pectinivorans]|uniref:Uncharacterized protein n=1 Tax=Natronoflexus pectinivorans TaxID=682526 RepID=A0A4R2GG13_9BACT|nr:hypothetical protein [Natronoflexus pectinivorans]TCO07121.1 hypothetical protein EV194_110124 [Natronoflexus pectinivorans]
MKALFFRLRMAFGCEKDEQPAKYIIGYIVSFDPCNINHQYRIISKQAYPLLVTIALCFLLIGGCQKNDIATDSLKCPVDSVIGSDDDIVGKWKLVKGEVFSSTSRELRTEDYSCNNIIYHFYPDGRLMIISDIEDHIGIIDDEYSYSYEISSESNNNEDQRHYLLKIDNHQYVTSISSSKLTIGLNPVDPLAVYESRLTAYFIRVQ